MTPEQVQEFLEGLSSVQLLKLIKAATRELESRVDESGCIQAEHGGGGGP